MALLPPFAASEVIKVTCCWSVMTSCFSLSASQSEFQSSFTKVHTTSFASGIARQFLVCHYHLQRPEYTILRLQALSHTLTLLPLMLYSLLASLAVFVTRARTPTASLAVKP